MPSVVVLALDAGAGGPAHRRRLRVQPVRGRDIAACANAEFGVFAYRKRSARLNWQMTRVEAVNLHHPTNNHCKVIAAVP